jgi:hypothetical protein
MRLSHARLVPVTAGQGSNCTWSWSSIGPIGLESKWQGLGHPTHSWGSAGPKGQWARGAGILASCGTSSGLWSSANRWQRSWCLLDPVAQPEGRVSWWCVYLVWPNRQGSCCVCVWHGAVAGHSRRGGEPGKREQCLCRTMGKGFGRLAGLLLYHGVEKPSTI